MLSFRILITFLITSFIILSIPLVHAAMSGEIVFEKWSTDASCATPLPSGAAFTAGSTAYAELNITNTGDVDMVNMLLRVNTYDPDFSTNRNYAHVWYVLGSGIDIPQGQSVRLCVPIPLYDSMRTGTWKFYIFLQTSFSRGVTGITVYADIQNPGDYTLLRWSGIEGHVTKQDVGETTDIPFTITNNAPTSFSGYITVSSGVSLVPQNTRTLAISLAPGETKTFTIRTSSRSAPETYHYNVHVWTPSVGQRIQLTTWNRVDVGGGGVIAWQDRLYTNQSVYLEGQQGIITLRVFPAYDTRGFQSGDYFKLTVKDLNNNVLYTETIPFQPQAVWEKKTYTSSPFTIPQVPGGVLSDFKVYFTPYYADGRTMKCYHCSPAVFTVEDYSPASNCSGTLQTTVQGDVLIQEYCISQSVTFVELTPQQVSDMSIRVLSGTLYSWREGENNQNIHGIFIYAEPGSRIQLSIPIPREVNLPSFSPPFFLLLIPFLILLGIRKVNL